MVAELWYPEVEDVLAIHAEIVGEYPDTEGGVRDRGGVEFALSYVAEDGIGSAPATIHRKAFHLLRLLVANHPFVDANKRTALNTTAVFYLLNGYRFEYDADIIGRLKGFATDESTVSEADTVEYLQSHTTEIDVADEVDRWRDDLVEYGLDALEGGSDPNG